MQYKKSYYNLEIDKLEDESVLLFNSNSCAYGIMNPQVKVTYENIENILLDNLDENTKKDIDIMLENGFIVNADNDELAVLKVQERLARYSATNSHVVLTIAPTTGCNMDCPYCYEKKNGERMNNETRQNLVNFVNKVTKDATKLSISWYGGEPLLELDTIRYLSKEFIKTCEEKKIEYDASIITNGILLNNETAKILADECKVFRTQITIDGLSEVHNTRRRLVDRSKDSFKIITDNIDDIKGIMDIGIRVNIDKNNYKEMDKLIDFFILEKKWTWENNVGFYFAPVHDMEEACNYGKGTCFNWKEFGELDVKSIRRMHELNVHDNLNMFYPKRIPFACGALTSTFFVIGPKGDIYKCWNYVGNKERAIGNIKDGIMLNKENISWLMLEMPKTCETCKEMPLCRGGCPSQRFDNGNKSSCSHYRISDKERLKLIYKNYKNGVGYGNCESCDSEEKTV